MVENLGEQQPGTAIIVKNEKSEKYQNIAFLSLLRIQEEPIPQDYAYTAMRGLILDILKHNKEFSNSRIGVIAIPSFALTTMTTDQKRFIV